MTRPAVRVAAASVVAALLAFVPAVPAGAAPARIVLEGRGWGHGLGMGQWGARGMAQSGTTWSRILAHYYRGARIVPGSPRQTVRVLVGEPRTVMVTSRGDYRLAWASKSASTATGYRFYRFRSSGGRIRIERSTSGRGTWRPVATTRAPVVISPLGGAMLESATTSGAGRLFRGTLAVREAGGELRLVNALRLDDYLRGVVPREMPAGWPLEALKAQAVAARTYALGRVLAAREARKPWDICATQRCQVYGGAARRERRGGPLIPLEHSRTDAAIRSTRARILISGGEPITAMYSSSTGGHTTDGGRPYLRPVPDAADRISPHNRWRVTFGAAEIESAWPRIGTFRSLAVPARDGHGDWGGRAVTVVVRGSSGVVRVSADDVRRALDLRSTWFRVAGSPGAAPPAGGRFRFARDLRFGDTNGDVAQLQRRLKSMGYFPAATDATGYFGTVTRAAVVRYQRAVRVPATGFVGPMTRSKLNSSSRPAGASRPRAARPASSRGWYVFDEDLRYGTRHEDVRQLQLRLRSGGLFQSTSPITDYFGNATRAAVVRYQRARGLPATGFVGPLTRATLNRR